MSASILASLALELDSFSTWLLATVLIIDYLRVCALSKKISLRFSDPLFGLIRPSPIDSSIEGLRGMIPDGFRGNKLVKYEDFARSEKQTSSICHLLHTLMWGERGGGYRKPDFLWGFNACAGV